MTTRRKFLAASAAGAAVAATGGGAVWGTQAFMRSEKFGALPSGDRLKRVLASPHYRAGAFRNEEPARTVKARPDDERGGVWSALFRKKALRLTPAAGEIPVVRTDLRTLPRDRDVLVWFGHSSCYLQTDGVRVLVDPVFRTASPVRFLLGEPFPGTDVYGAADIPDIDVLLITHDHWDHLEYETVLALKDRIGRVVCPLGVGAHFDRWGFDPGRTMETDWGETAEVSPPGRRRVAFRCLPSRHFSGRTFQRNQALWASYLVEAPSRTVYFAGDGGYDGRFDRIRRTCPPLDLAVLENGQYNIRWPVVHTLPDELPLAMHDLRARRVMTVHHAKFCISTHPWDEPFANEHAAARAAGADLLAPQIGEAVRLDSI